MTLKDLRRTQLTEIKPIRTQVAADWEPRATLGLRLLASSNAIDDNVTGSAHPTWTPVGVRKWAKVAA